MRKAEWVHSRFTYSTKGALFMVFGAEKQVVPTSVPMLAAMVTRLLRVDLNLGAGCTAYSIRWASVDYFLSMDLEEDECEGAKRAPRHSAAARERGAC